MAANLIYMTKTAWQSLLSSIKTKAGYVGTLTASQAKTAVDGISAATPIRDARYLFAYNARCNSVNKKDPLPEFLAMVKNPTTAENICYNSSSVEIDFSGIDFSNCASFKNAFAGCSNLKTVDFGSTSFMEGVNIEKMFNPCGSMVSNTVFSKSIKPNIMDSLFYGCNKMQTLDISGLDTSNVNSMQNIFYGCSKLASIDVSRWNTANVTSFNGCFRMCSLLTTLDLSNWTIGATTNMNFLVGSCTALESISFGANVASLGYGATNANNSPFAGCTGLKTVRIAATTPPPMPGTYIFPANIEHIYVPAAAVADYKAATNWAFYEDIIEADPEE